MMTLNEKEELVGVQIFGPHAGDLASEWVIALNGGQKLSRLVSAIDPYPTIGEINKKVERRISSQKRYFRTI